MKRAFDVTAAVGVGIILLPIILALIILVWSYDRKNPFFSHSRIGWRGRPFKCWKFRSMAPNSSEVLARLLDSDPAAHRQWSESQKLVDDPRITPIGRILRSSSLDELPQLFNVLRGDMSIVGPRPIVTDEISRYGAEFDEYCACRPGVTGLWQVSGRSDCSYGARVAYDAHYVRHWSLWFDLKLIVKTIPAVLSRRGSY